MAYTYRLTVSGTYLGQVVQNVLHYHENSDTALSVVVANWIANVLPSYVNCLSVDYEPGTVKAVRTDTLAMHEEDFASAGTVAGDPMPPQVTGLISWRSGIASRSGRGRTYMPALTEGEVASGYISAGLQTRYGNFATAAQSFLYGSLVIYHRDSNTYIPVVSNIIRTTTFTQRRRGFGRGV